MGESSPRFTRHTPNGPSHSTLSEISGKTLMSHDPPAQFKLTANASSNNFNPEE